MNEYFLLRMLEMLTGGYAREDVQHLRNGREPKTNIGKLFSIPAWSFQIIHEHAEKVRLWDDLDYAEGNTLDRYGANFGVARSGLTDDYYRLVIKVKMLAQISGGDIDTVIRAAATLLGVDDAEVEVDEVFPAKVWIYVDEDILSEYILDVIHHVAAVIKRILAAGVGMRLFLRTKQEFFQTKYFCTGTSSYIRTTVQTASKEDIASWQNTTS